MAVVEDVTVEHTPTRAQRGHARRKRRTWPYVAVVILVAVGGAIGTVMVNPDLVPDSTDPGRSQPPAPAQPEEPTAADELPPVGDTQADRVADRVAQFAETPPTEDGAAQAAAAQLSLVGSTEMFRPTSRAAILDAVIDPKAPAGYVTTLQRAYTEGVGRLGLTADGEPPAGMTFHSRELILGVDVVDVGSTRKKDGDPTAVVEIWHGGLVGLTGPASSMPVRVGWTTTTITMRHDGTTWRWVSTTREDGPVPVADMQMPSGSDELDDALTNTEEPSYAG